MRDRVASRTAMTSATRPTSAPIVAKSGINSSSIPQSFRARCFSWGGGTAGNGRVRVLSSAVQGSWVTTGEWCRLRCPGLALGDLPAPFANRCPIYIAEAQSPSLPKERRNELVAEFTGTNRHRGPDRLTPWTEECDDLLRVEHILEDKRAGRVSDGRADEEPRPLDLRQRAAPGRCCSVSRLLVLCQPARAHGCPPCVCQNPSLCSGSVQKEARGAGVVDVGGLVHGQFAGAPNEMGDCCSDSPVVPHTTTNALPAPAFGHSRFESAGHVIVAATSSGTHAVQSTRSPSR